MSSNGREIFGLVFIKELAKPDNSIANSTNHAGPSL